MVPVRQPRGTAGHQTQARVRQGRAPAPGLADHLLLRRSETPWPGHRAGSTRGRARPDRPGRRGAPPGQKRPGKTPSPAADLRRTAYLVSGRRLFDPLAGVTPNVAIPAPLVAN